GSPPTQLNRKKISRITPARVWIICHSLRTTYAVIALLLVGISPLLLGRGLLLRDVDVEVLEVGIEDRVFLVALHPSVLQVVEDAVHAQAPGRVGEQQAVHLAVELVALGAVGEALRALVGLVVLGKLEARLVRLARV